MFIAKAIF